MPSLMCLVRSAATAMKTSGDEMISNPAEWCSPIHASSKPRRSMAAIRARSRSMARVGFCPTGWNGAMKFPKRMWSSLSYQFVAQVVRCYAVFPSAASSAPRPYSNTAS